MDYKLAFMLIAIVFSLSACSLGPSAQTALPTPTTGSLLPTTPAALSLPTETQAPPSPLPSPIPTLLTPTVETRPSPFPSPTPIVPSPTPAPAGLNPTGPYVLFKGQAGVWIANPDGGFPTRLSAYETRGDLRRAVSPAGDRLALVVRDDQGLELLVVRIPGGEAETITRLIDITPEEETNDPTSPKAFAAYAIRDYDSLAWQPGEGRLLAFIGAMRGPTADLYLYDTQTREITQLTDGPSQAIMPTWSPDGRYILHYGVSWVPPFGGAIVGANRLDGVWSVRIPDGRVKTLPRPKGVLPNFVGWLDDAHYLTYDSDEACYAVNLRSVAVADGETAPVMPSSFYYEIARSSENGTLLFSSAGTCTDSLGEGVFLLLPGQGDPVKLLDKRAYEIYWMPESQVFFAYPEALISPDGEARYDPPVYDSSFHPAVSKQGYQAWEVIQNRKGRVVVGIPGGDWQAILEGTVRVLIWDPVEGRTLLIALGDGSLYAASYPAFTPRLMGDLGGIVDQAIWLP